MPFFYKAPLVPFPFYIFYLYWIHQQKLQSTIQNIQYPVFLVASALSMPKYRPRTPDKPLDERPWVEPRIPQMLARTLFREGKRRVSVPTNVEDAVNKVGVRLLGLSLEDEPSISHHPDASHLEEHWYFDNNLRNRHDDTDSDFGSIYSDPGPGLFLPRKSDTTILLPLFKSKSKSRSRTPSLHDLTHGKLPKLRIKRKLRKVRERFQQRQMKKNLAKKLDQACRDMIVEVFEAPDSEARGRNERGKGKLRKGTWRPMRRIKGFQIIE